jgi:hypothetical protein
MLLAGDFDAELAPVLDLLLGGDILIVDLLLLPLLSVGVTMHIFFLL